MILFFLFCGRLSMFKLSPMTPRSTPHNTELKIEDNQWENDSVKNKTECSRNLIIINFIEGATVDRQGKKSKNQSKSIDEGKNNYEEQKQ